ncbi:hypothetical protein [Gymnodinialimonas ulvae]|uniref:hypothetical protein n=1 Tax=Gymnodinialimonas ulvae TaxID=3126504 RepID=UPI0030B56F38
MLLPNFLKRAMRRSLSRNGELVYDNRMQAERFRELVATPDLIIDVGVANGTPWLYDAFPQTEFILIDPMDECEDQVASRFPNLRFLFH